MSTGAIQADADRLSKEPPRAVTHDDVRSIYQLIAALAALVGRQSERIAELERRPKAGRPPKS